MNIKITSRKFKAKDSLKTFIKDEIKTLEKYFSEILDCNVILSFTHVKDSIKTAEVIVKLPGHTISVEVSTDEFEKSVSQAVEKIQKQLIKLKTKRVDKKKVASRKLKPKELNED
ncbi:MAG: ribosome-associated translation inhibitor RaiA [Stygiobacter sp.]|jgi:putative sigma-54 modulation protein|uniref:Ribosome-associated translation inhibitor RaiA n=1 Tax=Stygiobacter electus TaxID=3032292 RepID=A0AAE3TDH9_9BACT|nr:ribosome-associated translation inhibitor RaiA [Stygiobacter electus]MDF1611432.1 ribosome-associated translation inhibitor RaiA [Stygiobacter electus]